MTFTEARCLPESHRLRHRHLDPARSRLGFEPDHHWVVQAIDDADRHRPLPPDKVTKSLPVTVISLSWAPTQSSALPADLRLTRGWVRRRTTLPSAPPR
ncbi:MAG: hypothetical protein R2709_10990 [Marmoricola sp.]